MPVSYPAECARDIPIAKGEGTRGEFVRDRTNVGILTWLNTLTNAMEFMQSFLRSVSLTPAWCAISRCNLITCCSRRLIKRPSWPTWYCCCCGGRWVGHTGAFIQSVMGSVIHAVLVGCGYSVGSTLVILFRWHHVDSVIQNVLLDGRHSCSNIAFMVIAGLACSMIQLAVVVTLEQKRK